jgi:putative PEP-CTERM system TPR-repeat lipoprotein
MCAITLRLTLAACLVLAVAACTNPETAKHEYLASGDRLMAEGRVDEAIIQYRNAIRHDNSFGEARWRLAEAQEQNGNLLAALREYVRAADLLPENVEVQVKAAVLLLMSQQFEDARTRAEKALEHDPRNPQATLVRANAMAGLKDVRGAIRDIEEALEVHPGDASMHTGLGMLRSLEGQDAEAAAAFARAIEVDPGSIDARLALAAFHWSGGREEEVEEALEGARRLDESHVLVNRMLMAFYLTTGRAAEAERPLQILASTPGDNMSGLVLADYYVQMGRTSDAVEILRPMTEGVNPSGAAMLRLAEIERMAGRRGAAKQMLDDLLAREPRNAPALTSLARWHLGGGDTALAIETARTAVDADPASPAAHFTLGMALAEDRQTSQAASSLAEVLRINPRFVVAQLMLSRLQLAEGNVDAAVQLAADAKREAPDNPEARLMLARGLVAQGNLPHAESEIRGLITDYPQVAAPHAVMGQVLMARRDVNGARAAFTRALELDPNSVDALRGLLRLDAASGSVPAAVSRIETRLAANPKSAPLQFVAAETYAAARQTDRAEKALRDGIALDPNNMQAYFMLGQLLASEQRLEQALAEFEIVAARQPNQSGAPTMAGIILEMLGREEEARKRYEATVAAFPRAAVAANNLAWMYAERGGNLDVALQLAQSAKAQLPDSPEVNDTLGWIYYKQNLPRLAIPPLEQSVAADPSHGGYHLRLGLAYAKAGEVEKAHSVLDRALALGGLSADEVQLARQTLASTRN